MKLQVAMTDGSHCTGFVHVLLKTNYGLLITKNDGDIGVGKKKVQYA